jgi:membrane protein implicated in regulation of membrane protease activity
MPMIDALRDRAVVLTVTVGMVYFLFVVGWFFRGRLGLPASRLRRMWIVLILAPAVLVGMVLAEALLSRSVMGVLATLLCAVAAPWILARQAKTELTDPLCGRDGVITAGHPADLRVDVDGQLWHAQAEDGQRLLVGVRVVVKSRKGVRLVVGPRAS